MQKVNKIVIILSVFFSSNVFANTLVCNDVKLYQETFIECADQDASVHGGQQFCGRLRTVTDFVPQINFVIEKTQSVSLSQKNVTLSVNLMNTYQPETVNCVADKFGGNNVMSCTLSNGMLIELVEMEINKYRVIVFTPTANTPSGSADNYSDQSCKLN